MVLFTVSFAANVIRLDRPFAGAFSLLMVVLLWLSRREFQAPPDPPTLFQFLRFVPLYLAAVVVYGLLFLFVQRQRLTPELSLGRSLDTTFSGMIGLPGRYAFQSEFVERVFRVSLLGLGVVGVIVALGVAVPPDRRPSPAGRRRVGAREPAGPVLRLRHAAVLRPPRRQELLLLLRRRGDDRLHLHRSLRPGVGRPDRAPGIARPRRSTSSWRCAGSEPGGGLPGRARARDRDRYVDRRPAHLLPGRRGDGPHRRASASKGKKSKSVRQSVARVERTFTFELYGRDRRLRPS